MKSRILNQQHELKTFAQNFSAKGNPVNLEYIQRAKVRGFFNSKNEMFAGYVVNSNNPLRYEKWIPKQLRPQIELLSKNIKIAEITCIWIQGKEGKASSELIYLQSVIDALLTGASFILGGTLSPIVFGIQTQSLPEIIFSGDTTYFGKKQRCWIYGASRMKLIGKLFTTFPSTFANKLLGRPSYLTKARIRAKALGAS